MLRRTWLVFSQAVTVALAVLLVLVLLMIWLVPKLVRFVGRMFDRVAGLGGVRSDMTGGRRGGTTT